MLPPVPSILDLRSVIPYITASRADAPSGDVPTPAESTLPLYEYRCNKCSHRFEKLQKLSAPPKAKCPECGSPSNRQLSAPAIQFKGTGWYVTDYGRSKSSKSDQESKESKEPKESKGEKGKDGSKAKGTSKTDGKK
jgi:putative FmdB family regulatory protein